MPDVPVAGPGDDDYHRSMEERVSKVEADIRELKSDVRVIRESQIRMEAMLDAMLPHLATKAEVADLRTEIVAGFGALRSEMIGGLAEKPSKTYMWGILAVLLTAYACGLAGLAILK